MYFTKRYRTYRKGKIPIWKRKRIYKSKYYRRKSIQKRKFGTYGKVGIYIPSFGAKLYISRKKYRVMHSYARLIANDIIARHHMTAEEMQVENQAVNQHALVHHKSHARMNRKEYFKLIRFIMVRMITNNWYHLWYLNRNHANATHAAAVLEHGKQYGRITEKEELQKLGGAIHNPVKDVEGLFNKVGKSFLNLTA
nr:hypothetical protein [Cressdnaviricota sp.]